MKVPKIVSRINNYVVKKYRNSQLRKGTSDFDRELYVNRYGSISASSKKYGAKFDNALKDGIWIRKSINPIAGDTWVATKYGAKMTGLKCRKSTLSERIHDFINVHIRKIDLSI